jgi:hypothetical protein
MNTLQLPGDFDYLPDMYADHYFLDSEVDKESPEEARRDDANNQRAAK